MNSVLPRSCLVCCFTFQSIFSTTLYVAMPRKRKIKSIDELISAHVYHTSMVAAG